MSVTYRKLCPGTEHGTSNAYRNHGCRCDDARRANTRYRKLRAAGLLEPGWVPSLGVVRRRQALAAVGYGLPQLVPHLGRPERAIGNYLRRPHVTRETFAKWVIVYELLREVPGPSRRARDYARQMGWHPPEFWGDDIDEPLPVDVVDEVAVERVLSGNAGPEILTVEERALLVERARVKGLTPSALGQLLRCRYATAKALLADDQVEVA